VGHSSISSTVTEENPEYPADEPVVIVCFRDYFEENLPEWDEKDG
jgi:hypothetical protein